MNVQIYFNVQVRWNILQDKEDNNIWVKFILVSYEDFSAMNILLITYSLRFMLLPPIRLI